MIELALASYEKLNCGSFWYEETVFKGEAHL